MKKIIIIALLFVVALILLPNLIPTQSLSTSIEAISIQKLENLSSEKNYSYEEILEYMEKEEYDSEDIEQFKKNHEENLKLQSEQSDDSAIGYARFRLDGIEFTHSSETYQLQPEVLTGLLYLTPDSPSKIISLESLHTYTGNGTKAAFSGKTTSKLVSGQEIYTLTQGTTYKEKIGEGFLKDISHQETYYSPTLEK